MSRYHRENPDLPIQHDWLEGVQHIGVDPGTGKDWPFPPRRYICERCGGTGIQPAGCWDGKDYAAPAGKCDLCKGSGELGVVPRPQQSAE